MADLKFSNIVRSKNFGEFKPYNTRKRRAVSCHGCVKAIQSALVAELDQRGYDSAAAVPWYFPTLADYSSQLAKAGFGVSYIAPIPRPTPLPDIMGWLATFSGCFTSLLPSSDHEDYPACVRARIRPRLRDPNGNWTADYVCLRFKAYLKLPLNPGCAWRCRLRKTQR